MNFQVVNKVLQVENIRVIGFAASSVLLVGDAKVLQLSAAFDTPPDAVTPIVQLPPAGGRQT